MRIVCPDALPCGCRLKNAQGAWIAGRYAPTQLNSDGTRTCRHGRTWKASVKFVEVNENRIAKSS